MDDKKLMVVAAVGTAIVVILTMRSLKQLEDEQKKITDETIKVLGEYRQYLADLAKNN